MGTGPQATPAPRPSAFAAALTRYRRAKGWTQEELGAAAGVGRLTINKLERGARTNPTPETIAALTAALELGPTALSSLSVDVAAQPVAASAPAALALVAPAKPPRKPTAPAPADDTTPSVDDGLPSGLAAFLAAEHDDLTNREKREVCSLRLERTRNADADFWRRLRDAIRALPISS
jgi:transcriptional regulator with XRE-family HTH domain